MTTTKQSDLESVPSCPLCGVCERTPWHAFPPFAAVRCRGCGLGYLDPRLTERAMQAIYEGESYYAGDGYQDYEEQTLSLAATCRRFVRRLGSEGLTGGRLLEVGCGYGHFLAACAGSFAQRVGTEMSAAAARRAREHADTVHVGGIEAISSEATFDLIVANQVVEHVYDPVTWVKAVASRLSSKGSLVLATPDAGGLLRRLAGRRWPSFKVPEHVTYFDESTLGCLLRTAGLEPRRIRLVHAFPMAMLFRLARIELPRSVARVPLFVPTTTLAMVGRR